MPEILDIEVTPIVQTLEEALLAHAEDYNAKLTPELAIVAKDRGLIFDTTGQRFTDEGFDFLEANGVTVKWLDVITTGKPLTVFDKGRNKKTLAVGSQLVSINQTKNRKTGVQWDDCYIGEEFPVLAISYDRSHVYSSHRWPIKWGLQFVQG